MSSRFNKPMIWKFMALLAIFQFALPMQAGAEQQETSSEKRSYKRGRIRTTDGYEIKFSSLAFSGNEVTYVRHGAHHRLHKSRTYKSRRESSTGIRTETDTTSIDIDKVIRVEIESGSKAAEMGLGFFVAGALGSVLGLREKVGNGFYEEPSIGTKLAIGAGVTIAMTLVGMVWGSTIKEYKTVWTNPSFENQPKSSLLYMINRGNDVLLCTGFNF